MIAPLPACASVLGLVVEDGLTVNTTLLAAAALLLPMLGLILLEI